MTTTTTKTTTTTTLNRPRRQPQARGGREPHLSVRLLVRLRHQHPLVLARLRDLHGALSGGGEGGDGGGGGGGVEGSFEG